MNVNFKVRLPDHNFPVGDRHSIIPSAHGVCTLLPSGKVSYTGETFISLRSGKHDSSTAYSHAYDLNKLFENGSIPKKPLLILETDGAADEAPRSPKTLATAIHLFKILRLDAYIHGVNASGLSAFNPIERYTIHNILISCLMQLLILVKFWLFNFLHYCSISVMKESNSGRQTLKSSHCILTRKIGNSLTIMFSSVIQGFLLFWYQRLSRNLGFFPDSFHILFCTG